MSLADICNAAFELFGGVFILNHCRALFEAKIVKGISIVSTVFFTAWGVWNLYYYPSLGQWASFAGGVFICLTNLLWVAMLVYYRRNPGGRNPDPVRRVVCAANRYPDGLVVCGPRHFDSVMHAQLRAAGGERSVAEQGFVDQHGVFLTREEAMEIARAAGQIVRRCGGDSIRLFSENLY